MSIETFDPAFDIFEDGAIDEAILASRIREALRSERAWLTERDSLEFQASQYIIAEIEYIQNLHELIRVQNRQQASLIPSHLSMANNTDYFRLVFINAMNLRFMEDIASANTFVIGGPEEKYKAMTMHKYNPDLHWVMPDDHMLLPTKGADIMTLTSEVGINVEGQYEQLINAVFSVPDYKYPGIEWDVLEDYMHTGMKSPKRISLEEF